MASARKDKKGRALYKGENEHAAGGYYYQYMHHGKRRTVYAPSLPELREKEDQIKKAMMDGLDSHLAKTKTLNNMFDEYMRLKTDIRETTRANYTYMYNHFVRDSFGKRKVGSIKYTDVKEFYLSILQNDMMKASTLESIHTVVRPSMQLAVRNDIIMKNPCNDVMAEIKRSAFWEKDKRHALTEEEQDAFLQYLAEHEEMRRWYIVFTVLIGTGMRLGEFSGLRWDDVDFEENYIDVNHQAVYYSHGDRKCRWGISIPKTENGVRIIPMLEPVREALLEEYEWQKEHGFSKYKLDGYSGFVFTNRFDNLYNQGCLNKQIERIRQSYNQEEEIKAKREKRRPLLLPHFTNHQLRHTFCSRLCEQDVNVKLIQEVMGHADVSTTFDIYAEFSAKKKKEAFKLLDNGSIIKTQKKAKQDDNN